MTIRAWFFSLLCIALLAGCQRDEPKAKFSTTDGSVFRAGEAYTYVGDGMFERQTIIVRRDQAIANRPVEAAFTGHGTTDPSLARYLPSKSNLP